MHPAHRARRKGARRPVGQDLDHGQAPWPGMQRIRWADARRDPVRHPPAAVRAGRCRRGWSRRSRRPRIERILHAGDWTTELAVDLLEAIAPVDGVAGNNDGPELHERFGTQTRGRDRRRPHRHHARSPGTRPHDRGPGEERLRRRAGPRRHRLRPQPHPAGSPHRQRHAGSSTRARRRTSAASHTPPGRSRRSRTAPCASVELVRGPAGSRIALSSRP